MSLYVNIIGIDGSGKSTVTPALADLVAAELAMTAAALGDDFRCKTPEEDLFLPGFAPDGQPLAARLARLFRRGAKAATAFRRVYPPLKLAHLAAQEQAARQIERRYRPDVLFCDGNLFLSSAARAINYMQREQQASLAPHATSLDPVAQVEALYGHAVQGRPLPPGTVPGVPGLHIMRLLCRLDEQLQLGIVRLPDALIFLDVAPETALARLVARGRRLDRHENLHDLTQAQAMYRGAVEFFRRRRGASNTCVIDMTGLSVGESLRQAIDFVRTLPVRTRHQGQEQGQCGERLGTTELQLDKTSTVIKKVLTYRYLGRYVLPHLHQGSAHELTFPLSPLGRLLLREGYSAGVMKAIYLQDSRRYGLLDRVFLDYPLHRAVYHRLAILQTAIEKELRYRLEQFPPSRTLKIMTAPSGYAFDVLQPVAQIARSGGQQARRLRLLASDLDPDGRIESELAAAAHDAGIRLTFVRGDLTAADLQPQLRKAGPYDVVVFVGLSAWISKPDLVRHLRLVRHELLARGGVLFADCFTPQAYALAGKYAGYRANYYHASEFTSLLAYCGFDPAAVTWESGPEGINHVCVARTCPAGGVEAASFRPGLGAGIESQAGEELGISGEL